MAIVKVPARVAGDRSCRRTSSVARYTGSFGGGAIPPVETGGYRSRAGYAGAGRLSLRVKNLCANRRHELLPRIEDPLEILRRAGLGVDAGHRFGARQAEEEPRRVVEDQLHAVG